MLKTECRNPKTYGLDKMSTMEILEVINEENQNALDAVNAAMADIARVCDAAAETIGRGGRVFYLGAGTSGRLAVCDAAECPPTFGVPYDMFNGLLAGGLDFMAKDGEAEEDIPDLAVRDLQQKEFSAQDIAIGISASGSAEYVAGGLKYAKEIGAVTVSITNNPGVHMADADIGVCLDTGAEVITGSTRMKAGTAQKVVLNMISTSAMVKCGYVYQNMMINLEPLNKKLSERMVGIVAEIAGCDGAAARERLDACGWNIRRAVGEDK